MNNSSITSTAIGLNYTKLLKKALPLVALFVIFTIALMLYSFKHHHEQNEVSRLDNHGESITPLQTIIQPVSISDNITTLPSTIPPASITTPPLIIQNTETSSPLITNDLLIATEKQPTIFVITPTYTRAVQKAELTRQCQTFSLVNDIHWIVIEDSDTKTELVDKLLNHCPVNSTLLNRKTSSKLKKKVKPKNRGAMQRNIGLEWLRDQYKPGEIEGVVYFADDDNTYDKRLFDEMRFTKKVSVWPVGFTGGLFAEGPICKNGHVTGFHTGWAPHRKFPLDMAAFAVNVNLLLKNPEAILDVKGTAGYLETNFLEKIVTKDELEARASNCIEILVWHTQTKAPVLNYENKNPTSLEV